MTIQASDGADTVQCGQAIHIIKMPDIGEGIAEVELVMWHVQVGDPVAEDQVLADIMTDKATIEIPSPVAGKVMLLGGVAGQVMAVGSDLIHIEVEGQGNVRPVATAPAAGVVAVPLPSQTAAPAAAPKKTAPVVSVVPVVPVAPPAASISPSVLTESGADKPIAAPAVRRRAWELGIELQDVPGSGAAGRITQGDLDAWVHSGQPLVKWAVGMTASATASASAEGTTNDSAKGMVKGTVHASAAKDDQRYLELGNELDNEVDNEVDNEQTLPLVGLRRKIAQKMQESKRRIPHFSYVEEVDVTELEVLRANLNQRHGSTRGRLTLLPLLMRAVVLAVRDFPQINASFDDEACIVTRYKAVHIGIATQTGAGLMVSVVRHAQARDLWSCASEMARLADAARSGKATRAELSGSTITISSLGALGGIVSTPIINHPEVAIVGVNKIVERPMMRGGLVVARKMMNLSSSFDHRVVDGMHAAEFIQALRVYLESPALLFVE